MQFCSTTNAPEAIGPYSQGVEVNGFYFFSGQIALTHKGEFLNKDIETQTIQVLKNIEALILSQDLKKENIVKCTIFLSNMDDFEKVNELYADFFGNHKPARSCVEVSKIPKNAKIEIEVIATKS